MNPRDIQAVLFDVYGTLLLPDPSSGPPPRPPRFPENRPADSLPALLESRIRARHRQSPHPFPEIDIREVWTEILPGLTPDEIETFAVDYERWAFPCRLMPGADRTLLALRQRGLPLGIVSNAQFLTPPLLLAELGFWPFDDGLLSWSYLSRRAKPDPACFLPPVLALEARGIPRASILYVGNDVAKDILPARELGLSTALLAHPSTVRWHDRSPENLEVDLIVSSWDEFLARFDANSSSAACHFDFPSAPAF